jgi:membrane-associated phospholipid phosphatase
MSTDTEVRRPPATLRHELALAARRLALPAAVVTAMMALLGLLVAQVLAPSWLGREELGIDRELAGDRTPTGNAVTGFMTNLASTPTIIALTAIAAVLCRIAFHRWREALFVVLAVVGETAIFTLTTLLVDRERPTVPKLDEAPPTSSFPSGHTAAAICFYGAIAAIVLWRYRAAALRVLVIALAVLIPLGVAASRLYRGMHFPSDVLGGVLLGVAWLTLVTRNVLHRDEEPLP